MLFRSEIAQFFLRESATAAVAALALYMLRKSYEQRMEDLTEQRNEARAQRKIYQQTLTLVAERLGENAEASRQTAEINRQVLTYLERQNGGP